MLSVSQTKQSILNKQPRICKHATKLHKSSTIFVRASISTSIPQTSQKLVDAIEEIIMMANNKSPPEEILSKFEKVRSTSQQAGFDKWSINDIKGDYKQHIQTDIYKRLYMRNLQNEDVTLGPVTYGNVNPNDTKIKMTNLGTVKITDTEYIFKIGYKNIENDLCTIQEYKGRIEYLQEDKRFDVDYEQYRIFPEYKEQEQEWIAFFKPHNENVLNGEMVFQFENKRTYQQTVVCVISRYLVLQGTNQAYVIFERLY